MKMIFEEYDFKECELSDEENGVIEERIVIEFERIDEEQEFDEDEDECIKECYDDMSLSGFSDDDHGNEDYEQDDDGCIDMDAELEKFNKELHNRGKCKKLVSKDVLRVAEIKEMAKRVLNSGTDCNGKVKLEQQKMLHRLHEDYEGGDLQKCLLSMYLKLTEHHRVKLIKDLEDFRDGKLDEPPKIPQ